MKKNDMVAVSLLTSGVVYGRVVSIEPKRIAVSIGGNIVWAEHRHVTKIWDKKRLTNEK